MEGGDSYRVGDEVEALYKGGTKWFKGSIAEVRYVRSLTLGWGQGGVRVGASLIFEDTLGLGLGLGLKTKQN